MARDVAVTVVAVCVLVLSGAAVWNVSAYRAEQRVESMQADPVGQTLVDQGEAATPPSAAQSGAANGSVAADGPADQTTAVQAGDETTPTGASDPTTGSTTVQAEPARRTTDAQAATTTGQRQPRTPQDYDGDGIPDAEDRCPTRPETMNGFQDGDGCPDVVETTGAS